MKKYIFLLFFAIFARVNACETEDNTCTERCEEESPLVSSFNVELSYGEENQDEPTQGDDYDEYDEYADSESITDEAENVNGITDSSETGTETEDTSAEEPADSEPTAQLEDRRKRQLPILMTYEEKVKWFMGRYKPFYEENINSPEKQAAYDKIMDAIFVSTGHRNVSRAIDAVIAQYADVPDLDKFLTMADLRLFLVKKENAINFARDNFINIVIRPALESDSRKMNIAAIIAIAQAARDNTEVKERFLYSGIFEQMLQHCPTFKKTSINYNFDSDEYHLVSFLLTSIYTLIEDYPPAQERLIRLRTLRCIQNVFHFSADYDDNLFLPLKAILIVEKLFGRTERHYFTNEELAEMLNSEGWCEDILAFLHIMSDKLAKDGSSVGIDVSIKVIDDTILPILRTMLKLKKHCPRELRMYRSVLNRLHTHYNKWASFSLKAEIMSIYLNNLVSADGNTTV